MPKKLYAASLASSFVGAVFGPMCLLAYAICGGMAVGFYLETDMDSYLSDRHAMISGAFTGLCSGVLSAMALVMASWMASGALEPFVRNLPVKGFGDFLLENGGSFWGLAIGNLAIAVIVGLLGGWGALHWIFPERRIPLELQ